MAKKQSSTRTKTRSGAAATRTKTVSVDASEVKRRPSRTHLEQLRAMIDEAIQRESDGDLDPADFATLDVDAAEPQKRTPVLLKMEPEVLAFFKAGGRGYQTRMIRVLRHYMEQVRRANMQVKL